jgi:hypothetical protein
MLPVTVKLLWNAHVCPTQDHLTFCSAAVAAHDLFYRTLQYAALLRLSHESQSIQLFFPQTLTRSVPLKEMDCVSCAVGTESSANYSQADFKRFSTDWMIKTRLLANKTRQ